MPYGYDKVYNGELVKISQASRAKQAQETYNNSVRKEYYERKAENEMKKANEERAKMLSDKLIEDGKMKKTEAAEETRRAAEAAEATRKADEWRIERRIKRTDNRAERTAEARTAARARAEATRNSSLHPTKESSGGYKNKKPSVSQSKEILGKQRRIYKVAGSRKEHVKYKGQLIPVSDYKKLMKPKH
jgi:hypothetical protein